MIIRTGQVPPFRPPRSPALTIISTALGPKICSCGIAPRGVPWTILNERIKIKLQSYAMKIVGVNVPIGAIYMNVFQAQRIYMRKG